MSSPFPGNSGSMQQLNFEDILNRIVEQDKRYQKDAYLFLREALEFTQKSISKANKNQVRHITGQELLNGIREYALAVFGPMTMTVFEEWGIKSCEDFGNMVFLMVENNLLRKTEQDRLEDFKQGYDFEEAFRKPFLPSGKRAGRAEAAQTEVEKN
jgi:uncharacterized repeat protein (TIGR04138 family)